LAFWDRWFGKRDSGKQAAKSVVKTPAKKTPIKVPPKANPIVEAARAKGRVNVEKRFKLINRLGQGSMSQVWRANDTKTGNMIVLKILDIAKTNSLKSRFIGLNRPDEGEVAVQLDHPNIVKTYEFGMTTKNEEFLVMEFVDGVGFNFLVETRAKQLLEDPLRYLIPMGEAISYFHKMGFIHRDICPRNVMVSNDGVIKLIDFGLAVPNTPEFRKPGNRTGTATHMAPELIRRMPTDPRIDIYSFGVTVYETYTGKLPREMLSATLDALLKYINTTPRDPREHCPDMPDEVARVILKGIESNPEDRYQTMDEFLAALRGLSR
jgi:serine/threonine protein kinase